MSYAVCIFILNEFRPMSNREQKAPGEHLLAAVRAGFVQQGTSLSAWCEQNGVARQNVRTALLGGWNGPRAQELRTQIVLASKAAM